MLCVVYVLRKAGKKLPLEVVKARPFVGWLYFGPDTRKAFPQEAVRLFRGPIGEQDVIDPLVHPFLRKIQRGGMLFRGCEEVRSSVTQPQTWWVRPGPLDDTTSLPAGL